MLWPERFICEKRFAPGRSSRLSLKPRPAQLLKRQLQRLSDYSEFFAVVRHCYFFLPSGRLQTAHAPHPGSQERTSRTRTAAWIQEAGFLAFHSARSFSRAVVLALAALARTRAFSPRLMASTVLPCPANSRAFRDRF